MRVQPASPTHFRPVLIPCGSRSARPRRTLRSLCSDLCQTGSDFSGSDVTQKGTCAREACRNGLRLLKDGARRGVTSKVFCVTKHCVPEARHEPPPPPHVHTDTLISHSPKGRSAGGRGDNGMIDEAPEGTGGVDAVPGAFPDDYGRFCSVSPRR